MKLNSDSAAYRCWYVAVSLYEHREDEMQAGEQPVERLARKQKEVLIAVEVGRCTCV